MMDLLERYLAAVARQLPERQKADVAAELRDVLLSQIEEREEGLGRPLAQPELEQLLLSFGNPLVVAGRYRKIQHLIGPEVFPFWWAAMKVTLLVIAAVFVGFAVLGVLVGPEHARLSRVERPSLFGTLVFAFGAVTLVCAVIERLGKTAALSRWNPGDLPAAGGKQRSHFEIALEGVFGGIAIFWWLGLIQFSNFIPFRGLRFELAQVWQDLWWPILGYLVFEFVSNVVAIVRPGWRFANAGMRLARNVLGLVLAILLAQAGHWVDVSGALEPHVLAEIQANANRAMRVGMAATIIIFVCLTGYEAWRSREVLALRGPGKAASA